MPRLTSIENQFESQPQMPARRSFFGKLAAVSILGSMSLNSRGSEMMDAGNEKPCDKVRALLISATTLAGHKSLEHAEEPIRELFAGKNRILLINFASLPNDRDAYAARMQRDFSRIDSRFSVDSLHTADCNDARKMVEDAEAVYVSGGNTFLLLRELYDRKVVGMLRNRIYSGMPYAGSSAGSNIGGVDIGTTNDFPMVDVPTRRSLGILPGTYNPHHPDPADKEAFASRQYKIHLNTLYYPEKPVFGVNNAGMISIKGNELTLLGEGGIAAVQLGTESSVVDDHVPGNLSSLISRLKKESKS